MVHRKRDNPAAVEETCITEVPEVPSSGGREVSRSSEFNYWYLMIAAGRPAQRTLGPGRLLPIASVGAVDSPSSDRASIGFSFRERITALLPVLLVATFLLGFRSNYQCRFLVADDVALLSVEAIIQRADKALARKLWDDAEDCFRKALVRSVKTSQQYIHERLQWCYANTSLEQRYSDESMAQYVRAVEPVHAEAILTQTLQLIKQNYYQKFDLEELREKSLLQLQAATENPLVYRQFSINESALDELKHRLQSIRIEIKMGHEGEEITLVNLSHTLRKVSARAGLGASWPALELAYAFADSLDSYSCMLSPGQYRSLLDQLGGYYVGTGLDLIIDGDYPLVFDVVDNSPAQKCGLVPGDCLIRIEGINCRDKTAPQVVKLLVGEAHTRVSVTVKRDDKEISSSMMRELIEAPSVRYVRLLNKRVGFLRVASFDHDTALEMRRAIDRLRWSGAESLLIDLRRNGGGVVSSAIEAVRLFIDSGTIVTVCVAGEKTRYSAGGDSFYCYQMPMAILVDEKTASAAEIFTAALQDHHRAVVVGEKTLGKAVVQTIYDLDSGRMALCITTALYIPPGNRDINHCGLIPDILVEKPQFSPENAILKKNMKDYLSPENPTLKKAMELLELNVSSG